MQKYSPKYCNIAYPMRHTLNKDKEIKLYYVSNAKEWLVKSEETLSKVISRRNFFTKDITIVNCVKHNKI